MGSREIADQTDLINSTENYTKDRDSIYSIFDPQGQKFPLKSSMRDISNERSPYQHKTVSFQEAMLRNNLVGEWKTSVGELKKEELNREISPFDRSMANYKATVSKLLDIDLQKVSERKKYLEEMKKEREQRNSKLIESKSFAKTNFDVNYTQNKEGKSELKYLGINDDLEEIGMKAQNKTQIYAQKQTKRKLDYNDLPLNSTEEVDEEKDLNLTPHILEESKLMQSDTSHINTTPNKSEDTNYINITHHHKEISPSPTKIYDSCTEETPKAIISIERK
jgi:hypothetical protein